MHGPANPDAVQKNACHQPNSGFQAQVTIAGVASEYHVVDSLHFGYDVAPAAPTRLEVAFGAVPSGVVKFGVDIPADVKTIGPHQKIFRRGLYTGINGEDVQITLIAGGVGRQARLNVTYR